MSAAWVDAANPKLRAIPLERPVLPGRTGSQLRTLLSKEKSIMHTLNTDCAEATAEVQKLIVKLATDNCPVCREVLDQEAA